MAIIGFNLEKISIERKNPLTKDTNIKTRLNIKKVQEEDIKEFKDKATLSFYFEFEINYEPKIASILFTGYILTTEEKEKAQQILKEFKKKQLNDETQFQISNVIWQKCNIKALHLEQELNLPPHLPLPQLQPKSKAVFVG